MSRPKDFVRLSINISKPESDALEAFAEGQLRAKTEIVREWLRTLPTYTPPTPPK